MSALTAAAVAYPVGTPVVLTGTPYAGRPGTVTAVAAPGAYPYTVTLPSGRTVYVSADELTHCAPEILWHGATLVPATAAAPQEHTVPSPADLLATLPDGVRLDGPAGGVL